MSNATVEIIKAVAMPVAIIVTAICVVVVVIVISRKGSPLRVKFRDWFEIDGHAKPIVGELNPPFTDAPSQNTAISTGAAALPSSTEAPIESATENRNEAPIIEAGQADTTSCFFSATDPDELKTCFTELEKDSNSFVNNDPEFWQTHYINRLHSLSKTEASGDLEKLRLENPTWIWPLINLIDFDIRAGRMNEAKKRLMDGMPHVESSGYSRLLAEGVVLLFRYFSPQEAYAFVEERTNSGISDNLVAAMVGSLANVELERDPSPANQVLREIELSLDSTRNSSLWKLAYGYGEHSQFELLAYRRYRELVLVDESTGPSLNNMGVIAHKYSREVGISHQEDAAEMGELYAIGNIASDLIKNGHLNSAARLLESTENNTTTTIVSARTAMITAVAERDKKLDALRQIAMEEGARVRQYSIDAFDMIVRRGENSPLGTYMSKDKSCTVTINKESGSLDFSSQNVNMKSMLEKKNYCYSGTIIGTSAKSTLVFPRSITSLTVVIMNNSNQFLRLNNIIVEFVENCIDIETDEVPTSAQEA